MLVRKIRGQEKLSKIIMPVSEIEMVKRLGIPLEQYVKQMLLMIAKERRWKWYLEQLKEKQ
jgi:hypothetical protein